MDSKTAPGSSAYSELIDLIALGGGPEAVIAFRPSDATQDRAYELIYKERDGRITPGELAELSHYVELEHILRLAKLKARKLVSPTV